MTTVGQGSSLSACCGPPYQSTLNETKKKLCGIEKDNLVQGEELLQFLQSDGIYIDNQFMTKLTDLNVQKLEERLLNNEQKEYFKANGEIKLDNDVLSAERTRPVDLAFEQSDMF